MQLWQVIIFSGTRTLHAKEVHTFDGDHSEIVEAIEVVAGEGNLILYVDDLEALTEYFEGFDVEIVEGEG